MRKIKIAGQFEKDVKRIGKRSYEMKKLSVVISALANDIPLEARHRDHSLKGNYIGFRECHLAPDWLLIYRLSGDDILELARTGSHSDLFN